MIRPYITERLLMGRKESNQTNKYLSKFQVNTVTKIEVIWKNVLSRAIVMVIGVNSNLK